MKLNQHYFLQQKVTVCGRECPHTEHNFITFPFLKLIYLTVCSGYTFSNTFIDIAQYTTYICIWAPSAILQRYIFHTVRGGKSDTVVRKWPRHGKNRASTTLADFPFIPHLSENISTTTFWSDFLRLSPSVSTGITLKCTPLSLLWDNRAPARHVIALPAESTQSRGNNRAFTSYVSIASILRQILLSIIPMQQSSHIFSYSYDAIQNSF